MLEKGIACVTVGFPATGLTGARVRFCISAAHTREMLDMVNESLIFSFYRWRDKLHLKQKQKILIRHWRLSTIVVICAACATRNWTNTAPFSKCESTKNKWKRERLPPWQQQRALGKRRASTRRDSKSNLVVVVVVVVLYCFATRSISKSNHDSTIFIRLYNLCSPPRPIRVDRLIDCQSILFIQKWK